VSATFAGVSTAADVTMWAFNGSTLLGTVSGTQVGQFVLTLNGANITSVAVRPGSFDDWVGVDNIVFAPIPEPGTYGMMALGLVGIGLLMRRRQRA
jgi:PEP-CTERM motif